MIQELTDILSQIPEEQKQGLEESVRDLLLTEESTIELKMGGGAFPDEGLFSLGISLIVRNTQARSHGNTTLQDLVDGITKDIHGNSDRLLRLLSEQGTLPYQFYFIELGFVAEGTSMLHMSIDAPLKEHDSQPAS